MHYPVFKAIKQGNGRNGKRLWQVACLYDDMPDAHILMHDLSKDYAEQIVQVLRHVLTDFMSWNNLGDLGEKRITIHLRMLRGGEITVKQLESWCSRWTNTAILLDVPIHQQDVVHGNRLAAEEALRRYQGELCTTKKEHML